jgi:transposase InsO family protein
MKEAHDSNASNHQGQAATVKLLQDSFFWPKMAETIKSFVVQCELCQKARSAANLTPGLLLPLPPPTDRWSDLSMDFIGPLPETKCKHNCILTVVDRMTKRVRFLPCRTDITTKEVAQLFFDNIVSQFGLPKNIVSDRGSIFTSEFWSNLFRILGTSLSLSTVDHPQSDGQSERAHRTLLARLRTLINHEQDDWDLKLSSIEFQMNSTVSESTGFAPFVLDIGRLPRSALTSIVSDKRPLPSDARDFAQRMKSNLSEARDNIIAAQEKQRTNADLTRREQTFKLNDLVLVESEMLRTQSAQASRPKSKLDLKFDGPFKVTEVVSINSYRLDIPESFGVFNVFNVSKLRPFVANTFKDRAEAPPAPVMVNGSEERFVHAVLARKANRGRPRHGGDNKFKYLVHWAGERHDQASWEPESSFTDDFGNITTQAVLDFNATHPIALA